MSTLAETNRWSAFGGGAVLLLGAARSRSFARLCFAGASAPGHEFMGEVMKLGGFVKNLKVGDRVVVPFTIACGDCWHCHHDMWSLCENSNPNAAIQEAMMGHAASGALGFSHLTGGYAGGQAEFARVPFADVGGNAQLRRRVERAGNAERDDGGTRPRFVDRRGRHGSPRPRYRVHVSRAANATCKAS